MMSRADYWCDKDPIVCSRCGAETSAVVADIYIAILCSVRSADNYDREQMMEPEIRYMATETTASWFPLCGVCVAPIMRIHKEVSK